MRYIIRNIIQIIKKETLLAVVIVLCVFSSAWVMAFSYGLYQNYNVQKTEAEMQVSEISPTVLENTSLTKGDLIKYLTSLSDELCDDISVIAAWESVDFYNDGSSQPRITFRFGIRNGSVCAADFLMENWSESGILMSGRLFTDEEESVGANVALMPKYDDFSELAERSDMLKIISENKIEFMGKEYEIIGQCDAGTATPIVPVNSMPDDFEFEGLSMLFKEPITKAFYNELMDKANDILPGVLEFPELPFPDRETIYLFNNIMLISAGVAVLTIINFAALYYFILHKRIRQLAAFNICGASKAKVFAIYFGECCIISFPVFALGIAAYIPVMKNVFSNIFPYMESAYSPLIYLSLFGIYAVILIAIISFMLIMILRKNATQLWKEAKV